MAQVSCQVTLFQSETKCKAVDILFIYTLVIFVSEIERVRFLIRQQLVHKYPTPHFTRLEVLSIFTSKVLHLASFEHESSFNSEKAWV